MKRYILIGISLLASLASGECWAQKQILPDFHADPSAHHWDGKYWIYPSTDEAGSTTWDQMKRWSCYSSTDLAEWTCEGEIFSLEKISWADNAAFAPDAVKRNGKYYFFFPAGFQIGVAISDKPNGPFVDALGEPMIKKYECKGVSTFDPCIFTDDDNTPYLYYGGGGGCAVVKLKDNLIERDGELQKLPLRGYGEGIWVHKHNGTYYFTYPEPIHHKDGSVTQVLSYSTSKSPTGPFEYHGEFFVNNSRNSHHSIIEIEGKWYLFYHVQGPSPYERRVCVDYLTYDQNGLINTVEMTKEGIQPLK